MRIWNAVVCIWLMTFFGSVAAEVSLPQTPAGQRAAEVLTQLNLADKEQAKKFIENTFAPEFRDAFPMAMHLGVFTATGPMFGELEVFKVVSASENDISLLFNSVSRDAFIKIEISVEPDQPHRITGMGITPAQRPEGLDARKTTDKAGKSKSNDTTAHLDLQSVDRVEMDKLLSVQADSNNFSGTVLVAKDGKPLFQNAYGYASRKFGIKNRLDTKFNLGSLNKLFTSIAITQLIEQGKVSIDAQIGEYLDDFPDEIADKVTLRQLLQMRAGWGDYWGNEYFLAHRYELRQVSDYMDFIKLMPLDFEPGTNFQHCNTCFEVLGAVIESVSGMDYYEYVRQNIYVPTGMEDSGSFHRDSTVSNIATGYTNMNQYDSRGEDFQWTNDFMLPARGTPTGGGFSTVGDFLKFDQAFRNFELLDQDHTEFAMSQFKGSPGDEFAPPGMATMMGGASGIGALYARESKSGITILIFSNLDFTATIETFREMSELMGLN